MLEESFDVSLDSGLRLSGTVVRPQNGHAVPAVLIISGSGPLDRDSNMPGQTLNIAHALASHLAQHGIASLRYDKRGVGTSSGDYLRTGFDQEHRDALSTIDALRGSTGIDPRMVAVIGHSVGATIAIRVAAEREWLAAAVLLSAAAGTGLEVMRQQSERIAATMPWWWRLRRFLRTQERERSRLLESRDDVITVGGQDLPARWFREYMQYDPAPDLHRISCPVLAITGGSDVQVDPGDVNRIRNAVRGEITVHTPEYLTHLLRIDAWLCPPPCAHTGKRGLRTYEDQMRRPVDAGTLNVISGWLVQRLTHAGDATARQNTGML